MTVVLIGANGGRQELEITAAGPTLRITRPAPIVGRRGRRLDPGSASYTVEEYAHAVTIDGVRIYLEAGWTSTELLYTKALPDIIPGHMRLAELEAGAAALAGFLERARRADPWSSVIVLDEEDAYTRDVGNRSTSFRYRRIVAGPAETIARLVRALGQWAEKDTPA